MNRQRFYQNAFTLVELIVVISVIGIMTTIITFSAIKVQQDQRDSKRSTQALIISESLEKYFEQNGEYPTPLAMSTSDGLSISSKLGIPAAALVMPGAKQGVTNSIIAVDQPSTVALTYKANRVANPALCQTLNGGCDDFTLQYIEESSGDTITINSRNSSQASDSAATPDVTPTVEVTLVDTNVVAESSVTECTDSSLTAKYTFQNKTNTGSWSTWSSWSEDNTRQVPGSVGNTYSFKVKTRCDNSAIPGSESPESAVASYTYPFDAPATPVAPALTLSGTVSGRVTAAVSCSVTGSTPQYAIRSRVNSGTWAAYTAWSTTLPSITIVAGQGAKYGFQAKTRCYNATAGTSSAEASSAEKTYTHPISTPATPAVTVATVADISTWSWNAAACPAGATARYQLRNIADWDYNSGLLAPIAATKSTWQTSSQGYQYTMQAQAQCYTANTSSAWSGIGSASYIRPVAAPGAPTAFVSKLSADKKVMTWSWTSPTCGPGALGEWKGTMHWNEGTPSAWNPTISQGYWTPSLNFSMTAAGTTSPNIPLTKGIKTRVSAQYICINKTTGRTSTWGPLGTSPLYIVP